MIQIQLSSRKYQGLFALIDDADATKVLQHTWFPHYYPRRKCFNAVANINGKTVILARFILDITDIDIHVDHRNHNPLDNRRSNLRPCSSSQNVRNKRIQRNNTSGFKGITWSASSKKWVAKIFVGGKTKHIGVFHTKQEAAEAYDSAALKFYGEFACTNFEATKGVEN